jgi:hypothetical protein
MRYRGSATVARRLGGAPARDAAATSGGSGQVANRIILTNATIANVRHYVGAMARTDRVVSDFGVRCRDLRPENPGRRRADRIRDVRRR